MGQRGLQTRTAAVICASLVVAGVVAAAPDRQVDATSSSTTAFRAVGPERLADTRRATCGCHRLDGSTIAVDVVGRPGVPDDVVAIALSVTATPTTSVGHVTVYPLGSSIPNVSTLNTRPDRVVANSAIVPIGDNGAIAIHHLVPTDLIVDMTGVFVATESATAGRYVPLDPSRVLDMRRTADGGRPLGAGGDVTVPLPPGVPHDATALVVNVTSVGEAAAGHLSVRPAGSNPATTSFLNTDGSGRAVASSIIAPASPAGITIRSFGGGFVIVDIVGWFTGPSAPISDVGLFRPETPRRLLDTRLDRSALHPEGTIELAVPAAAAALVTNMTVTQSDRRGWVAAYPAGTPPPPTSAVNPAFFGHTVANMAITSVSTRGIAYTSRAGVDVVVDTSGSFTGQPAVATLPSPSNVATRSQVFIVGDSTLAGVEVYPRSHDALRGFDSRVDAASCRRLLRPSCHSNTTNLTPNTAVEAIAGAPGHLDIVVVKAGYNDWFSDFPREFDAVVATARAKGAHTILWMTQNERVTRNTARRAYEENNVDLRWLTRLPQYDDVELADWQAYSDPRQDWFHDGTHVNRDGAYAITDYIARWIAALEHRPCPRPWVVGGPIPVPCPPPDGIGAVPDPYGVSS